jgi:hypothetical protein
MKSRRSFTLISSIVLLSAVIASWLFVQTTNTHIAWFGTAHTQQWLGVFRAKYIYALVVGDYMSSEDINLRQDYWPAVRMTRYPGDGFALAIGAPYWMVAMVFLISPIWRFKEWIRRRRRRANHLCENCGHDLRGLRGTPDRCPECGASAAESAREMAGDKVAGGGGTDSVRAAGACS